MEHLAAYARGAAANTSSSSSAPGTYTTPAPRDQSTHLSKLDAGAVPVATVAHASGANAELTPVGGARRVAVGKAVSVSTSALLEVDLGVPLGGMMYHRGSGVLHTVFSPCG